MAIFWCDPYIESPSLGVHGTTGTGTLGSYANPYSLNNLPDNTGYTAGDEVRLKSLPASPWLTGPVHASNSGTSSYAVYCTVAPAVGSFIKYTDKAGEVMYTSWNTANRMYVRATTSHWQGISSYADTSVLMYKLDPQYYISNMVTTNQQYFLRGQTNIATSLTAGWVSETARGGETIIQHIQPGNAAHRWFGDANVTYNKMTVDAPELTISQSHSSTSRNIHILGETVDIHAVIERSGGGSSNSIYIYTALTFKAHTLTSGSYVRIYSPYYDTVATQGINRDVKYIMSGYVVYSSSQGAAAAINRWKFKNLACINFSKDVATQFNYYDQFYVQVNSGPWGSQPVTEMALDSNVSQIPTADRLFNYAMTGTMGSMLKYGENHNYRNYGGATAIIRDGSYILGGAIINTAYGDVHFRDYTMPSGDTLEGSTYNNVTGAGSSNSNYYQGTAWGVDRNSGRRLAFVRGSANTDSAMMMYNSTEYSNKLVYHLMPSPSGSYFRNRIHMDMPTGVSILTGSQAYKLKFTLAGTTVGSVSLNTLRLEGNDTNTAWTNLASTTCTINSASGGAGAVVYSGTFSGTVYLTGMQQVSLLAQFRNGSTTAVAKICFESIELVNA